MAELRLQPTSIYCEEIISYKVIRHCNKGMGKHTAKTPCRKKRELFGIRDAYPANGDPLVIWRHSVELNLKVVS